MAWHHPSRGQQRGAVAVTVGILAALVLFGIMGIAIDLSYLYARKTELQNAADAAALSGARELDETAAGVVKAIAAANAAFAQNAGGNLIEGASVATIRLGSCPNPADHYPVRQPSCTFVNAASVTSNALASGLTFLEVDTGSAAERPVFFARVIGGPSSASTYGYAVAGRFVRHITPIGVCAIAPYPGGAASPDIRTSQYAYPDGTTELVELGFRRGVSYNIISLNPIGSSGVPFLINPVDAPPAVCNPNHSSANFTAPFVCQGNSVVGSGPGTPPQVYVNTGFSAGPMNKALNSRFNDFQGSPCVPESAPPDANIREFRFDGANEARSWTEQGGNALPNRQTYNTTDMYQQPSPPPGTLPGKPFANYGVLWSYTRGYQSNGSSPPEAGNFFGATDLNWHKLYDNGSVAGNLLDEPNYPASAGANFPANTPGTPYNQFDFANPSCASSTFYTPPAGRCPGRPGRRVLNIVILDCTPYTGGGLSCFPMTVRGIGKFFMQVVANLPDTLEAEFAGLVEPVPTAEIKLFR